jgi:hypothetical protein
MDICQSVLAIFFVRVAVGQDDLKEPDDLSKLLLTMTRNKMAEKMRHQHRLRRDSRRTVGGVEELALAVALLRLRQEEIVWPLLARSQEPDDPRVRSYLMHRFGPLGADAAAIINRLEEEKDVTVRRALVLSLGEFGAEQLPPHSRLALLPKLRAIYRTDADAGLHGATEWLLRRWDDGAWLQKVNLERAEGKEAQGKRMSATVSTASLLKSRFPRAAPRESCCATVALSPATACSSTRTESSSIHTITVQSRSTRSSPTSRL